MRLTAVLCRQNMHYHFKMRWKTKRFKKLPPLYKPKFIDEQGIEVVNPNELYKEKAERWTPPVPDDPHWMPAPTIEDHPHYHEEPIKAFFHDTKLEFGMKQASILAKAQQFTGLPESVQRLVGKHPLKRQDDLIRRHLMQAHVWDATHERLPKRFNPMLPRWKFKLEYGIPKPKITRELTDHLVRSTMSLCGKCPELLTDRIFTPEPLLETYLQYWGTTVQIKATPMALLSTNQALAPFGDESLLDASCQHHLDDLSPVSPLIDLKKSHIYSMRESGDLSYHQRLGHPHTLFLNNSYENHLSNRFDVRKVWSTEQRQARALLLSLAVTSQQAKKRFGSDVTTLPEPINLQCIHHDGVFFHFLYFQLNTLNLSTPDGLKNFVWLDSDNRMVEKIEPKRAMLRNTIYQNYDPKVYDKFRATFLNGVDIPNPDVEFYPTRKEVRS